MGSEDVLEKGVPGRLQAASLQVASHTVFFQLEIAYPDSFPFDLESDSFQRLPAQAVERSRRPISEALAQELACARQLKRCLRAAS